jgi:thiamine transport system permease protein
MSFVQKALEFVSRRQVRTFWLFSVIAFFLFFVVLPTIYVLSYAFTHWDEVGGILDDAATMDLVWTAILNSFVIASIVTLIDFLVGLPMAWILVRKRFRGRELLDTLIDMPLAVPTAALGFSSAIFWGLTPDLMYNPLGLKIVESPFLLIIFLHIVFSYPYMVRSLAAILEQIDQTYETAGRTLGASPFTVARTITLPLFRAGLVTGIILCFARSLSETGGTYAALKAVEMQTSFYTAPTLLDELKREGVQNNPELALISTILIVLALVLLVVVALVLKKVHIPLRKVWPRPEKALSRGFAPKAKDATSIVFLFLMVLLPSFFIFSFAAVAQPTAADTDFWGSFGQSLGYSFLVAGVVTIVDLVLGVPLALYIARGRGRKLPEILDVLVNVPLIVPTVALGVSLGLFWVGGNPVSDATGIVLVILAHIAFTYPLMVRNVVGAVEEVDPDFEETARTLGARPLQAFNRVLFPMIKASILAGAIMAFTRSLGETGATRAVIANANTAPNFIVTLIDNQDYYGAALACIILIIISYLFMLALRWITRRRKEAR